MNNDTSNFRDAQIQFDMYELATRIADTILWDTQLKLRLQRIVP